MGPDDTQQGSAALSDLGGVLLNEETVARLLDLVAQLAERALPSAAAVSVTLPGKDGPFTPNATASVALDLDEVQYAANEGPCLEALREAHPVSAALAVDGGRWPTFTTAALTQGMASILSVPLLAQDVNVGALNIYSRAPAQMSEADTTTALMLSEQAASVVACQLAYNDLSARASQLQEALASRDVIGQAKGILMKAEGCDANAAFDVLRRASQRSNRKLRDVAADLVASVSAKNAGTP